LSFGQREHRTCCPKVKAVEINALADAKLTEQVKSAVTDAAAEKLDADYKVALEKCEKFEGDLKAACVSAAKSGEAFRPRRSISRMRRSGSQISTDSAK
jgi:hypothetical protein